MEGVLNLANRILKVVLDEIRPPSLLLDIMRLLTRIMTYFLLECSHVKFCKLFRHGLLENAALRQLILQVNSLHLCLLTLVLFLNKIVGELSFVCLLVVKALLTMLDSTNIRITMTDHTLKVIDSNSKRTLVRMLF